MPGFEKTNDSKQTHKLYNEEIEIDFYPNTHWYKIGKEFLLSVTGCTGIIDKSRALLIWSERLAKEFLLEKLHDGGVIGEPEITDAVTQYRAVRDEAGSIGNEVHKYAEEFAKYQIGIGEKPEIDPEASDGVKLGINAFLDWFTANKVKFKEVEKMVYSKEYGYVGLADAIAEVNGKKMLIDYKTGKGLYSEAFYQVSAYRHAYEEEMDTKLDDMIILHFDKITGNFSVKEFTFEDYHNSFDVFLSCLKIKQSEKRLDKIRRAENKK